MTVKSVNGSVLNLFISMANLPGLIVKEGFVLVTSQLRKILLINYNIMLQIKTVINIINISPKKHH